MNKNFIYLTICAFLMVGCYEKQLIVVKQSEADITKATVTLYENGDKVASFTAFVGKNGIAKIGEKREGDGKTPSGEYPLTSLFGYEHEYAYKMDFIKSDRSTICVDDPNSKSYNLIVDSNKVAKDYSSFEDMLRDDGQYEIGAVIGYNQKREPGLGSCIFLHVQKDEGAPTAGCVSMQREDLKFLLQRLDRDKNPSILINMQ